MKMIATALAVLIPCAATAQTACADHGAVRAHLAEEYGETRTAIALSEGGVLEVYANLGSGTWTIVVTAAGGPTCLVAAGEAYQAIQEALPPTGDDS